MCLAGFERKLFAPGDANLSPCVILYIHIYFLCSCHLRNNPLIGGLEWVRKMVVREKKVEGWSGSGERRFRREGGETLNRCNSFSWTSAKSYIVSAPSILITFSSPFELYMSVFFLPYLRTHNFFVVCKISSNFESGSRLSFCGIIFLSK